MDLAAIDKFPKRRPRVTTCRFLATRAMQRHGAAGCLATTALTGVEPILQLVQSRPPGGNGMINQACARAKREMAGSAAAPAV